MTFVGTNSASTNFGAGIKSAFTACYQYQQIM